MRFDRVYVFVEGTIDEAFLRRILPQDTLQSAEVVAAGGSHGIPSLARSVLVRRKVPVAVLIDADSLDADIVDERQQSTEELIRAANAAIPVKVITAKPMIEAWFFAAPQVIARALGDDAVPPELVVAGKRDPKGVLQQLAVKRQTTWDSRRAIALLDDEDINRIRALPEVLELSSFLAKMQSEKAA